MSFVQVHKGRWTCSCYVWAVTESEWELLICVGHYNRGQLISFHRQQLSGGHKTATHSDSGDIVTKLTFHRVKIKKTLIWIWQYVQEWNLWPESSHCNTERDPPPKHWTKAILCQWHYFFISITGHLAYWVCFGRWEFPLEFLMDWGLDWLLGVPAWVFDRLEF